MKYKKIISKINPKKENSKRHEWFGIPATGLRVDHSDLFLFYASFLSPNSRVVLKILTEHSSTPHDL